MKMSNREMISNLNGLFNLQEKAYGELAYKISRNKDKLMKEYESFDKARTEAKKSYCQLDEQGNIKQENLIIEINEKKEKAKDQNGQFIMKSVFLDDEKEKEWMEVEKTMLDDEKVNIDIRTVKEIVLFDANLSQVAIDSLLFMIEEDRKEEQHEEV